MADFRNDSPMKVDETSSNYYTVTLQLPPFDPSIFDPEDVPEDLRKEWDREPDLYVRDGTQLDPKDATSAKQLYRRLNSHSVSPAVLALGKNPYPGLRIRAYVPLLGEMTPEYDDTLPWMGDNAFLHFITPDELMALGCVNSETSDGLPVSPQFKLDTQTALTANTNRHAKAKVIGNNDGIHPCFQRTNFLETDDRDYECLKPTLRIVTKMMEMESVMDLWYALGQPLHTGPANKMLDDENIPHRICYTGRSTHLDRLETKWEATQLRDFIEFRWAPLSHERTYAITHSIEDKTGFRGTPESHPCIIELEYRYRYILTGGMAYDPTKYNPAASSEDAHLRLQFHLALVILHEMSHAWFFNVRREFVTPFVNDHRIAEEGFEGEATISKGNIITPLGVNVQLPTLPFGMAARAWPGAHHSDEWWIKASAAKYGIPFDTRYAVPMKFIKQFFNDDFWNHRVERFGPGALNNFKSVGLRHRMSKTKFLPPESPKVKRKRDQATGLDVDDPEIEPDAVFPQVTIGIIYADGALSALGKEIPTIPRPAKMARIEEEDTIEVEAQEDRTAEDDIEDSGYGEGLFEGGESAEDKDEEGDTDMGEGSDDCEDEEEEGADEELESSPAQDKCCMS
ncbi:hypothetical protein D6C86_02805 [Aureobasidium pullulans]|uniref:Uncharacterized protein n=1 Tax=Aureobasidium pullulans TaxID=5580 RepID=A0A4S9WEV8_AURPU|nr:hypothetical protein D6C94_01379 [Aureobasidium pullulans]THZ48556.1 hypothetical protein D6C87_00679 [Aureobasidium pullulans]THZ63860.1 hypothetical protein D6C86_02805 [Aureobasidium pullulans]